MIFGVTWDIFSMTSCKEGLSSAPRPNISSAADRCSVLCLYCTQTYRDLHEVLTWRWTDRHRFPERNATDFERGSRHTRSAKERGMSFVSCMFKTPRLWTYRSTKIGPGSLVGDRLCGLVVRVSGYRYRGLGFDSQRYQIFWVVVGLERGPLSLVRSIEELLE